MPLRFATLTRQSRRLAADKSGAVAITLALSLPVLLGFSALALEYGSALQTKAKNQRTSDIAAFAAAHAYKRNATATQSVKVAAATSAAEAIAALNGVSSGVSVSFDDPGDATFVDVTISEGKPIFLSRLLRRDDSVTINTDARVELATGGDFRSCIVALDPDASDGMRVNGFPAGAYNFTNCGVGSNAGIRVNGNGSIGTTCAAPSFNKGDACDEQTLQSGFSDPFADLTTWPDNGMDNNGLCDHTGTFPDDFLASSEGGTAAGDTLESGVLCVTAASKLTKGTVESDAGGIGNALMFKAGVDLDMKGNAGLSIKPMETGDLAGVAIYAPGSHIDLGGTPDFTKYGLGCLGLVAGSWRFSGNTTVNAECGEEDANFEAAAGGSGGRPRLTR